MNSETEFENNAAITDTDRASSDAGKKMSCEQILTLAMDMGEKMIICGAEANRVEDTITRICTAYGCVRVDVFSITSYISTSIMMADGHRETQARRIYSYKNNLDKLEYLNAVSRYICNNTPAYDNIEAEVAQLKKDRDFPWWIVLIGYALSSGAFAIFFGGSIKDGLVAAFLSLPAYLFDLKIKPLGINLIMYNFFCTFILGAMSRLIGSTGIIDNPDKVLIGLVMIYIPGIQMTNSLRDILCGDIMSGILRLIEAVLLAVSIAAGFATSVLVLNALF